jgi:predicted enzyme related to lactoylglutathione lyase
MNISGVRSNDAISDASVARVDMKLEVAVIPVSDVDRAKEFYGQLGWRLDADFPFDNGFRVVQFTPPGSGCSVQFGTNMTSAAPGSAHALYLIVSDIEAARDQLVARGVEVSELFHTGTPGAQFQDDGERSHRRARARSRQLPLLRHVQRPGRQRLAAAGDHDSASRAHRRCHVFV